MIQFNKEALMRDLKKECEIALIRVAEKAKQAMIYELSSHPGAGSGATGRSNWNREVADAIDYVAASVGTDVIAKVGLINDQQNYNLMFKSLLISFGSGTKMDTVDNPWLASYLTSDVWNSNRASHEILTRPGDTIYDLETDEWRKSNAKGEPYAIPQFSQPPTHFFENGMRLIESDFAATLETVVSNMDFSKYITTTKR